jgi:coenzyme F420-0:L-glutamate ligase/coenzyme F420-1:gamma-L-glutamate ligase
MFGLGAREAVLAALRGEDARGFGAPCPAGELAERLASVAGAAAEVRLEDPDGTTDAGEGSLVTAALAGDDWDRGAADARLRTAAHALGWHAVGPGEGRTLLRFRPATP